MNMREDGNRRSPVVFDAQPMETRLREGWEVVLSYAKEDQGPFLVDLSHLCKWDVQHASLATVRPWNMMVPASPGQCRIEAGRLLSRKNYTQAAIWHLTNEEARPAPEPYFTDVTDGLCLLALIGSPAFSVMERVSSLDLASPDGHPPFLLQGPVSQVPCQVVVLAKDGNAPVVLIAFSRGYGQVMAEALLEAGHAFGLRPGGEGVFRKALDTRKPRQGAEASNSADPTV